MRKQIAGYKQITPKNAFMERWDLDSKLRNTSVYIQRYTWNFIRKNNLMMIIDIGKFNGEFEVRYKICKYSVNSKIEDFRNHFSHSFLPIFQWTRVVLTLSDTLIFIPESEEYFARLHHTDHFFIKPL